MKTHAFQLTQVGGPDVLRLSGLDLRSPGPLEVRLRQEVVGFNFIDIAHRSGRYPLRLPSGIGMEAAGVVEEVGADVTDLKIGDRVIYKMQLGAYAEHRNVAAEQLVVIPPGLPTELAVAAFTKGLTAEFLLRRVHAVQPGETLLVHAAAGGVGGFLTQWAKHLGAKVIGIVGNEEKVAIAQAQGCDAVITAAPPELARAVLDATDGRGVDVVYDSVGRDTFNASIDCLRPRGLFVSYGSASGLIDPIDFSGMAARGAPFLTRVSIVNYYATRAELVAGAAQVFDLVLQGVVEPRISHRYSLEDAADCHADAEARRHAGSVVLLTPHHSPA